MPQYPRPCSLAEIRQLLDLAFDDAGLDAFCLDYFEEVYDRFGRGLQKIEKLTLLLNHCRRTQQHFHALLRAMHICHNAQLEAFLVEKKITLVDEQPARDFAPPLADYEVIMPSNFDLNEMVIECLDAVFGKQGLIAFLAPCSSIMFLNNLCNRLKLEWDRTQVCLKPLISIHSIHTPIERALFTITQRYKPTLQEQDVVFAVQCSEKGVIDTFWQTLRSTLQDEVLHNRLVMILSIHEDCASPEGTIKLGQPCFRNAHVLRWVKQVVRSREWPEGLVQTWTNHIVAECSYDNQLQIEWVYEHLEAMGNILKQHPSLDTFQQELEKRRQLYVQTSN